MYCILNEEDNSSPPQEYFNLGDVVLFGKWKNKQGRIVTFDKDKWGNPTVELEPIPKGRKKNKVFGLYRIWHPRPAV
jgi:hypothetical protein